MTCDKPWNPHKRPDAGLCIGNTSTVVERWEAGIGESPGSPHASQPGEPIIAETWQETTAGRKETGSWRPCSGLCSDACTVVISDLIKNWTCKPGVMARAFNPSTREVGAGGNP